MPAFSIINGLLVGFTVSTVAVFLFPIIKLTPFWLERSLNKKIVFHRAAFDALDEAMARTHNDPAQRERLAAQHDYHRAALLALAPGELDDQAIARPGRNGLDAPA